MSERAIAATQSCLDDFMSAFNARDLPRWEKTFNFPSIRFASNTMAVIDAPGWHKSDLFDHNLGDGWHHSAWDRRDVIHADDNKVHIDTRFTRYRSDDSVIGAFDSIYILTCEGGHWGIKCRSSFAP